MTRRAKLAFTAAAATTVAILAVALVAAAPGIGALAGILLAGAGLAALLAFHRGATPALVTLGMFVSLVPLLAITGNQTFVLWAAAWVLVGLTAKRLNVPALERATRTLVSAG
jgi:hypothetical protein